MHGTTPGEKWYGGLQFEAFGEGDKFGHGLKLGLRVSFCDHVGVLLLLGTGNQDDLSSVHTVLDCRKVLQLLQSSGAGLAARQRTTTFACQPRAFSS